MSTGGQTETTIMGGFEHTQRLEGALKRLNRGLRGTRLRISTHTVRDRRGEQVGRIYVLTQAGRYSTESGQIVAMGDFPALVPHLSRAIARDDRDLLFLAGKVA